MSNTEKQLQDLEKATKQTDKNLLRSLTLYKKLETELSFEKLGFTDDSDNEKLSDIINLDVLDSTRLIELIKEWEQINDSTDSFESYIRNVYGSELVQAHLRILRNLEGSNDLPF